MADPKLTELEELLVRSREAVLAQAPEHLRELGPILRKSAANDSLSTFRRFLRDHDIQIARRHLPAFRDFLIVNRIDLKDIEPAARERLRARTLAAEDPRKMSVDYRSAVVSGRVPQCRDCRWFVSAPQDGDPDGDKPCTQFGTKGVDVACYGFTSKLD